MSFNIVRTPDSRLGNRIIAETLRMDGVDASNAAKRR
jgi:hypothetical protein